MASGGCAVGRASSCRFGCSRDCSGGCSLRSCARPTIRAPSSSTTPWPLWKTPVLFAELPRTDRHRGVGRLRQAAVRRAELVLGYLGRYTHRVALANSRLVEFTDGQVSFRWKDYRHESRQKVMRLVAAEFVRRFLLHVLPPGFQRIRHYGLLANHNRALKLQRCRQLLEMPTPAPASADRTRGLSRSLSAAHRRVPVGLPSLRARADDLHRDLAAHRAAARATKPCLMSISLSINTGMPRRSWRGMKPLVPNWAHYADEEDCPITRSATASLRVRSRSSPRHAGPCRHDVAAPRRFNTHSASPPPERRFSPTGSFAYRPRGELIARFTRSAPRPPGKRLSPLCRCRHNRHTFGRRLRRRA